MITKEKLLKIISEIPDGEKIQVESVIGESFNFNCSVRVFINDDDGNYRLRVEAKKDESL